MSTSLALATWTLAELLDEFSQIQETVDPELLSQVYRTWNMALDSVSPKLRRLSRDQLAEMILDIRGQVEAARRFTSH